MCLGNNLIVFSVETWLQASLIGWDLVISLGQHKLNKRSIFCKPNLNENEENVGTAIPGISEKQGWDES